MKLLNAILSIGIIYVSVLSTALAENNKPFKNSGTVQDYDVKTATVTINDKQYRFDNEAPIRPYAAMENGFPGHPQAMPLRPMAKTPGGGISVGTKLGFNTTTDPSQKLPRISEIWIIPN